MKLAAVLLALGLCGAPASAGEEPAPGDLWFRVRDAYAQLEAYRDEIELEMADGTSGAVRFDLRSEAAGALRLTVTPVGAPPSSSREVSVPRRVQSSAWRKNLDEAVGAGAAQGLPHLALLIGGPLAVEEPEALAYEGREPCGDESCHVLVGSGADSGAWRLWIGERDALVRRSEVELRRGGAVRVFRAVVRPLPPSPELPGEVYTESIDVALSTLVVRVRDRSGRAVEGLEPADFRIRLGRTEVEVTAAEWVGEAPPADTPPPATLEELDDPARQVLAAPGRRILFFVQTSLHPSRLAGQIELRRHAHRFLAELRPSDLAAVVSFDSHLKLRADFTSDRERLREALEAAMTPGAEPVLRRGGEVSLQRSFDRAAARNAATPEKGLEVAARALIPIDGEKVVVWLGWGLGRFGSTGVEMIPDYDDALRALDAAHASVFTIDVTQADYHSLEVGLQQVAEDTGGTYTKSYQFPGVAMNVLQATLSGHYVLYFRRPDGFDGPQPVRVDLRDPRRGEILVPEGILR